VNPWGGSSWTAYTEYFQWQPEHNSNSRQVGVKAGQTLVGSLEFLPLRDAYNLTQRCGCAPPGHLGRRVILTENRSNDSGISVQIHKEWQSMTV
jgi:hypothetical protein